MDNVLSLFPNTIQNYYEPFLGGGSVLLAVLSSARTGQIVIRGKIYASDINPALIGLYTNIQRDAEAFIAEVRKLTNAFSYCQDDVQKETYYYQLREQFNDFRTEEARASMAASAMFLFLNKTCFRGLYREGPRGFNVPYGYNKNPSILSENHIREMSVLIQPVIFLCKSFEDALRNIMPGDFAYLDPPYAPLSKTSFVSYTSEGFNLSKHRELFELCDKIANNTRFVMSNSDVDMVRDAFPPDKYFTQIISCKRRINSKSPDSKTNEVLITNIVEV
jgi:DNA adenine methylase